MRGGEELRIPRRPRQDIKIDATPASSPTPSKSSQNPKSSWNFKAGNHPASSRRERLCVCGDAGEPAIDGFWAPSLHHENVEALLTKVWVRRERVLQALRTHRGEGAAIDEAVLLVQPSLEDCKSSIE